MNVRRTLSALLAAVCVALALIPAARAASEPQILQQRLNLNTNQLTLYVRHTGGAAVTEVNIGGQTLEAAEIAADSGATSSVTWFLVDNSTAMPQEARQKVADLILTILGADRTDWSCVLCTFSDRLSKKYEGSNVADLKKQLDAIDYYAQEAYLMNAIGEAFSSEASRVGTQFVRMVVISAGGGDVPSGKTIESFQERLSSSQSHVSNIPIYTIGCSSGENGALLQQMYSLSSQSRARSWNVDEINASDIDNIMRWEEMPLRVSLTIPSELRGKGSQTIEVKFADGTIASGSVTSFGDGGDTGKTDNDDNKLGDNKKDSKFPVWAIIVIVLLLIGLASAGAAIFLILQKRNNEIRTPTDTGNSFGGPSYKSDRTDVMGGGATDILDGNADDDHTTPIFDGGIDSSSRVLYLTDLDHPESQQNASLREPVTIGRGNQNRIILNDRSVSGAHCEIYANNYAVYIRDLNSSNGTYIGNDRVVNTMEISNGSVIRLGRVNCRVEIR